MKLDALARDYNPHSSCALFLKGAKTQPHEIITIILILFIIEIVGSSTPLLISNNIIKLYRKQNCLRESSLLAVI